MNRIAQLTNNHPFQTKSGIVPQLAPLGSPSGKGLVRILPLLGLLLIQPIASARTWTANDGRTLQGDFVGATNSSVDVKREDGRVVTIPFSMLSASSIAYAKQLFDQQQSLNTLLAAVPKLESDDPVDVQLYQKYAFLVKSITAENVKSVVLMIRNKLSEDLKYWKNEQANGRLGDGSDHPIHGKRTSVADQRQQIISRNLHRATVIRRIKWLGTDFPKWLTSVEKSASTQNNAQRNIQNKM